MINFSAIIEISKIIIKRPNFNKTQIQPNIKINDIRDCNWTLLKRFGFNGIIIDKDNCLTRAGDDRLLDELKHSWHDCLKTFGHENVLVVSNSAGYTKVDHELLLAETLTRQLNSTILIHDQPKPAKSVILSIQSYFGGFDQKLNHSAKVMIQPNTKLKHRSDQLPNLIVIGDRFSTDIILGTRLRERIPQSGSVLTILTQTVWKPESYGTRLMRWCEDRISQSSQFKSNEQSQSPEPSQQESASHEASNLNHELQSCFNLPPPSSTSPQSKSIIQLNSDKLLNFFNKLLSNLREFYLQSLGLGFTLPQTLKQLKVWHKKPSQI
ncbi:mitochondrial PGP phosphatase-domain-containing protein [Melampsora americana]|nr:mitochondrial PGP phosphatase-domain-containing protein [Melampsora americana]